MTKQIGRSSGSGHRSDVCLFRPENRLEKTSTLLADGYCGGTNPAGGQHTFQPFCPTDDTLVLVCRKRMPLTV